MINQSRLILGCAASLLASAFSFAATAAPAGKLLRRSLPPSDIGSVLSPVATDKGLPQSLAGIWWADFGEQTYVMSFAKATWNANTKTASLPVGQAAVFAYPSTDDANTPYIDGVEPDPQSRGLDFVFADDLRSATIFATSIDSTGAPTRRPLGATLQQQENGVWLRHRATGESYSLKRIVAANGAHEAAFAGYLRAFPHSVDVLIAGLEVAPDVTTELTLNPQDGDVYLTLPYQEHAGYTYYLMRVTAAFPVSIHASSYASTASGKPGTQSQIWFSNAYPKAYLIVHATGATGGKAKVDIKALPRVTLTDSTSQLDVNLAPGEFKQLDATVSAGARNFYRVSTSGGVLTDGYDTPAVPANDGTSGILNNYVGLSDQSTTHEHILSNPTSQPVTAHVAFTLNALHATSAGRLVVNGPSVTRTLSSVTDVDSFDLVVPDGYQGDFDLTVNEQSFGRIFANVYAPDRDLLELFSPSAGYITITSNPTRLWGSSGGSKRFIVYYRGYLNVANPDLTYTVQLSTVHR